MERVQSVIPLPRASIPQWKCVTLAYSPRPLAQCGSSFQNGTENRTMQKPGINSRTFTHRPKLCTFLSHPASSAPRDRAYSSNIGLSSHLRSQQKEGRSKSSLFLKNCQRRKWSFPVDISTYISKHWSICHPCGYPSFICVLWFPKTCGVIS